MPASQTSLDTLSPAPKSKTPQLVPPRTTPSTPLHILAGWKRTLPEVDVQWISRALFKDTSYGSFDEQRIDKLWWYPPQLRLSNNIKSGVDRYFAHALLLWMTRRLWKVRLVCPYPSCHDRELVSAGIHPRVRQVLDVSSFYLIASEDLQCTRCKRKVVSWSHNIVEQLDIGHRVQFPCLLTGRNSCDMRIVRLLRNRG
ncbi:hypothetical protein KP79_PYT01220 [Mizuhopecten yessoensis]|uniref:DUF6729 domain-containing protein n=1 Tax=Mizuhopecten yessoensis TaxID=6573 RepID=A0A210QHP3_MIZYE|nr:hypothetical protein KP79_PYT01220 [Mizuhopecten yessoensis]